MKKLCKIIIFFVIIFSFSFAKNVETIGGKEYVSATYAESFWGANITYYEESQIVQVVLNDDMYYFRVDSDKVKENSYINPFFINSSKFKFDSDRNIEAPIILTGNEVYFPVSFFRQKMYASNEYDVIVVGGDPEGISAAISSARNNAKTLLISSEDGLGGLLTFGMLNTLDMNYDKSGELLTKGIFEEFYEGIGRNNSFDVEKVKKKFEEMVLKEKNIDYRKNYLFKTPILENNVIKGIVVIDDKGEEKTFYGRNIIDATQDGDICAASGVPYFNGMEDINISEKMAATLVFKVYGVNWKELKNDINIYSINTGDNTCGIDETSAWGFGKWCYDKYNSIYDNMRLRGPNFGRQDDGTVLLNALQIFDVDTENKENIDKAILEGTQEARNILKYLKTYLNSFKNAYFGGVADELYIRETRHIQGEYMLKASDLLNGQNFEDKIAMGSYPVDIQSTGVKDYGNVVFNPDEYAIPYRCTVPLNIDNLFIVGKSASYSSIAAGSTRVVPVGMVVGESVGAIAVYCLNNNISPRELIGDYQRTQDVKEMLISQGVYLKELNRKSEFSGFSGEEKLNALVDLGILKGGYSNDFKLNEIATNIQASNCLINTAKYSGVDIENSDLKKYSPHIRLNCMTLAKMMFSVVEDKYDEYNNFSEWFEEYYEKILDGVQYIDANDDLTVYEMYIIIYNFIMEQ